ncbi:MAG: hypothetical protein O7B27_09465 [Gammaproteobacteria bacterium]|jgi:hypothetical protein|nr:hypothetical protein [Gammaproteobacteria bacterium]
MTHRRFLEVDGGALGFDHRHHPAVAIAEHVVRASPIRKRLFISDALAVFEVPAYVLVLRINNDSGEGFGFSAWSTH